MNLSKSAKATRVVDAVVAGTSDQNGTSIDMQGSGYQFESVCFYVGFGVITGSAVTSVKAQTSSDNSNWNDILGSDITVADSDDTSIVVLDIVKPLERYIRCVVLRGTQNAVIDFGLALQYDTKIEPVVHDATTVISSETHISAIEGTA